ncbi:hypothetical protein Trydic_g22773 [Trypoxylus dichotomus]
MKVVLILAITFIIATAAPQRSDKDATVVKNSLDNIGVDGYNFQYETSNGIAANEQGQLKNAGSDNEILAARGQFKYIGLDGVTYTVTYTADENGFKPEGAHLPVAP